MKLSSTHPTTQSTTPPIRLKSRWGCQNHPEASTATSFDGLPGAVGISGQILPPEAKRADAIFPPALLYGDGANAVQVDTSREPNVTIADFMVKVWDLLLR